MSMQEFLNEIQWVQHVTGQVQADTAPHYAETVRKIFDYVEDIALTRDDTDVLDSLYFAKSENGSGTADYYEALGEVFDYAERHVANRVSKGGLLSI